jgi:hypothetical protein
MVKPTVNKIFEVSVCKYLNLNEDYDDVITTTYHYDIEGGLSIDRDELHELAKQIVSTSHMMYLGRYEPGDYPVQSDTEPVDLFGFFGIKFIEETSALEYTCDGFRSKEPLSKEKRTEFMNYLMRVCKNYREGKYEICEHDFTLKLK